MKSSEIMEHYDYLMRLAALKCNSQEDAEDLVGDTMLAAFSYMHGGHTIEYPKTWLAGTLCHKYNDRLRQKYRAPVMVCLDDGLNISAKEETDDYLVSEEAARVRKELNHLAYITREVLIRFYYGGQSVGTIARGLDIPEGTVKSRLSAGRGQMKKGLENMEEKNHLPGRLYLSFGGTEGLKREPMSLVEGDLIAQNLLILAYEKPLSISGLSRAIGIPAAYIEPIAKKLVDGELMVQTEGGKLYADFMITTPQQKIKTFQSQLAFAHRHFDAVWRILARMSDDIAKIPCVQCLQEKAGTMLDRYAVLKALQDFQFYGTGKIQPPDFPKRRDGGRWFADALAIDAGYDETEYQKTMEYAIHGGHRTSKAVSVGRTREIRLCEFDTALQDNPHRFGGACELYFKHIIPLLWHIYDSIPLEDSDIPNEFISYMPTLASVGLIGYAKDRPFVQIPVLEKRGYDQIAKRIQSAVEEIKSAIGDEFAAFIASMKTPVPKHLTSVPELFRYKNAACYFVMAIVREAYEKGLHLKAVDYCCPPAVLVYEE